MPQWWEKKLTLLEKNVEAVQKAIHSEPDGLSVQVIARLKTLEIIKKNLAGKGDEYNQMANVKAIMKHYRAKGRENLEWKAGYVTYWANGSTLSDNYEVFDWQRFRDLSDEYVKSCRTRTNPNPKAGIWVEGVSVLA